MNAITFSLISIIICFMALSGSRIVYLIKFFLCLITSYWLLDFHYNGSIKLWTDSDFTHENISLIIENGTVFSWILCMLVSYSFFYLFLRYLILYFVSKAMTNLIRRKIDSLKDKNHFIDFVTKFSIKHTKKIYSSDSIRVATKLELNDSKKMVFNSFCVLIHSFLCWSILGLNMSMAVIFMFSLIILIMILYIVFCLPFANILDVNISE